MSASERSASAASYRRIIASTSITGGATIGAVLIGIARMKAFALLLGPAGIGIFGIVQSVLGVASALAGMGVGSSGVRTLAAVADDAEHAGAARRSLWTLTAVLALLGAFATWLLSAPLSAQLTLGQAGPELLAATAVAVGLTIVTATQGAELQSFGRIRELAWVRLGGSLLGSVAAVALVASLGAEGIGLALLALAAATVAVALPYQRGLPWSRAPGPLWSGWRALLLLGAALMASALLGNLLQLALRALISRDMGLAAAGLYQAAWSLSVANLGIILAAMVADYYPRLAQADREPGGAQRLVNQQVEVALLAGGPLLAAAVGLSPAAMHILYSEEFVAGAGLLQWHFAGDLFKLVGWCFGYLMIVRNQARYFLLAELSFLVPALLFYVWLQPRLGLQAAGVAYFLAYASYAGVTVGLCRRVYGVSLAAANTRLLLLWAALICVLLLLASQNFPLTTALVGLALAACGSLFAGRRLLRLVRG